MRIGLELESLHVEVGPNSRRIPGPFGPAVSRDTENSVGDVSPAAIRRASANAARYVAPVTRITLTDQLAASRAGRNRLAPRSMEEVHDERVALAFAAVVPLVHFFDLHELILSASAEAFEAADQPKRAPSQVPSRHG